MRPSFSSLTRRCARGGFSLVEVTLALGIVSFCIVGFMGLFLVGISGEQSASDQVSSLDVISAVTSDVNTAGTTNATGQTPPTKHYAIQFPDLGQPPLTSTIWLGDDLEAVPPTAGAGQKKYAVTYVVTAPVSRYGSFQVFLRVFNAAKAPSTAASLQQTSYSESVISKSVQ